MTAGQAAKLYVSFDGTVFTFQVEPEGGTAVAHQFNPADVGAPPSSTDPIQSFKGVGIHFNNVTTGEAFVLAAVDAVYAD